MKLSKTAAILAAIAAAVSSSASAYDPIYFDENNNTVIVNGQEQELQDAPVNIDGTMYVPLRAFAQMLGKNVFWKDRVAAVGDQDEETLEKMMNENYLDEKFSSDYSVDLTDIKEIKERLKDSAYNSEADPEKALSLWREDGSFEGVEYFNSDTSVWSAKNHIDYVRTMVQAAYSEGNKYFGDADLKEKIAKSLDYWIHSGRVECDNWYQQEIAVPSIVVDILIINPDEITDEIRSVLNAEAALGSVFYEETTDRMTERPVSSTGANLADKVVTSFRIAIATENEDELYDVLHLLENELRVFPAIRSDEYGEDSDGIKADYSFHQHVDQIQSGSYGEVLVNDVTKIINWIKDTKYMLSDNALNEFTNFLLDGQQWMFRNDYRELTTAGRHITRPDGIKGFRSSIKDAVDALTGLTQIERYDELMALKENRLGETDTFSGNKHFWLSDYMSHNRDGFHVGVKIASSRTKCGEVVNDENLLGYYLSDGVTTLMQDGDEYYNIMPLLDWNKLPGTTTPQGALKNLNDWAQWNGEHLWNWKGNCSFAGGVSDGEYGAVVMDYSRDGLDAHKSWFMFDDQMVALGNGINSYNDMDIYTNINQCVLDGDVIISDGTNTKTASNKETIDKGYVLHDGIGYISDQPMILETEERTGSYSTINAYSTYKDKSETNNIFQLGIDHGVKPVNGSYEYRTIFNADEEKMNKNLNNPSITVLRNDDKVQAVYDSENKITEAIFLKMDTLELPSGLTLTTNKKCALIIREMDDGTLQVTASNPTNEPKALNVTVNKILPVLTEEDTGTTGVQVTCDGTSSTIVFRLNEGIYGGSSTTYNSSTGFTEFRK
jgi:chondroitin AC lyase